MERHKYRKNWKIIPDNMWVPLIFALACNTVVYYGSRLFLTHRIHYDLSNGLDERIPFVPWTVCIYLGCYLFWGVNYLLGCRQKEEEEAFRFLSADLAAKLVCLLCFLILPTTNVRPAVEGNTVWDAAMRTLYRLDAADNLFPSIHCLTSWFCFLAVRKNKNIGRWYKAVSLLLAAAVCVSTLTTKQHVLADVEAGILLAEGSYRFVSWSGFADRYRCVMTKSAKVWGRDGDLRE